MTLEPDQLTRIESDTDTPSSSGGVRRWAFVAAAAALGVAAVISVSAALATDHHATDTEPPVAADQSSPAPSPSAAGDGFPVTLAEPGWICDEPADEKFACFKEGAGVLVTVRPASSHDAYLTDPDKASPDQYVSDVHGGVFATLIRMPDDQTTDVFVLGAALVWAGEG